MISKDGFDIERDTTYSTEDEIQDAINRFIDRFEAQGYYSTGNRERIPLNEIQEHLTIKPL